MVERANIGSDDASIMRCAVARHCIQWGFHKTPDGMVHIRAVELGSFGSNACFTSSRGQTCYSDMKPSRCLQLPEFAPYFEVSRIKGCPWVSLQFNKLVPSPSITDRALLSKLSSPGTPLANGSSQSHLDRPPTPQPAARASASSSADVLRSDPAKVRPVELTASQHTPVS